MDLSVTNSMELPLFSGRRAQMFSNNQKTMASEKCTESYNQDDSAHRTSVDQLVAR